MKGKYGYGVRKMANSSPATANRVTGVSWARIRVCCCPTHFTMSLARVSSKVLFR